LDRVPWRGVATACGGAEHTDEDLGVVHNARAGFDDCNPLARTPAAPWLAFTRLKAFQTTRLGMLNGFASPTGSV
jgi:hypothetical protein